MARALFLIAMGWLAFMLLQSYGWLWFGLDENMAWALLLPAVYVSGLAVLHD